MSGKANSPRRGNLLYDEPPLVISPTLAAAIGLAEAVVLQQVHYWLVTADTVGSFGQWYDGRLWVYNTYKTWQEQFPFWSESTIKRTITNLEERGLLLSAVLNKAKMDRTKWYTIDYDAYEELRSSLR